jgi:hypothetical protein
MPIHTPFIETQFPLEILSMESYNERKAGSGQTLTGLGKWSSDFELTLFSDMM